MYEICEAGRQLVANARLSAGGHRDTPPTDLTQPCEECVMELASQVEMLCGFPQASWTDDPSTTGITIRAFLIRLNDAWDDESRQLLKPYALKAINTKGSFDLEVRRSFRIADWAIRTVLPKVFEMVKLPEEAEKLRALKEVTDTETANAAESAAYAAESAAYAAKYAAYAAKYAAYAAKYAAESAAKSAAKYAAKSAAKYAEYRQMCLALLDILCEMKD